jgi:hypothetical protein
MRISVCDLLIYLFEHSHLRLGKIVCSSLNIHLRGFPKPYTVVCCSLTIHICRRSFDLYYRNVPVFRVGVNASVLKAKDLASKAKDFRFKPKILKNPQMANSIQCTFGSTLFLK